MLIRFVFRPLILMALAFLAACSSAATSTPAPLSQTFASSDSGIMLQYPAGWVASDLMGQVVIANMQAAVDAVVPAPGQFQARLFGTPISAINGLNADASPRQVIDFFASSLSTSGVTFNSATELTIGDHDAARLEGNGTDGQAVVLVMNVGNGNFVFASATAAPGELAQYEPTLQAILKTLTYTTPVIPTALVTQPEATP
jgi:hypothetical protein